MGIKATAITILSTDATVVECGQFVHSQPRTYLTTIGHGSDLVSVNAAAVVLLLYNTGYKKLDDAIKGRDVTRSVLPNQTVC